MAAFFADLRNTVGAGAAIAVLLLVLYLAVQGFDPATFWLVLIRWLHVLCGVMWIGLLWHSNFVSMSAAPALFWLRWSAMGTIVFGIVLAQLNGYLLPAYTLGASEGFLVPRDIGIGAGMWLGTVMWFNVWFLIWPNQQKALNLGGKYPGLSAEEKNAAAGTAALYSRINLMLSIPMLFAMVAAQNIY
jgi:uncharacterized membrane protein